jgi:hypothetical protein
MTKMLITLVPRTIFHGRVDGGGRGRFLPGLFRLKLAGHG